MSIILTLSVCGEDKLKGFVPKILYIGFRRF